MAATALLKLLVDFCLFFIITCYVVGMLTPPPLQLANVNARHCCLILILSPSVNCYFSASVDSCLFTVLITSPPVDCKFLLYYTFLLRSLPPRIVLLPCRCCYCPHCLIVDLYLPFDFSIAGR